MSKKVILGIVLLATIVCTLSATFNLQQVRAQESPIEVWTDYTLDRDITFAGDGFIVKADKITLDLNGHTITGSGTGREEGTGVNLTNVRGVTVKNGEIEGFFWGGIHLVYCDNNTITNNTMTGDFASIVLYSSNYNSISGSRIGNGSSIVLDSSNYNIISKTTVTNNADGIWLEHSSNNIISGNNIGENSYGIHIESSHYNSINGNSITANNPYGIWIASSSNNTVAGNDITKNTCAIRLTGIQPNDCSNNNIYHNNFIDNEKQISIEVYYYVSVNVWDDGYPSGGNYWNDYREIYPEAVELDDSGIWGTPYVINANNRDNYPLISPYATLPMNYIDPKEKVVNVGQSFNANINVGNAADLYASQFKLNWDPNLLDVMNVSQGSFLREKGDTYYLVKLSREEGYLLSSYSFLGPVEPVNGTGPILTLEFYAKNPGQTALSLSGTPFGTADGTVIIQGASTSSHNLDGGNTQVTQAASNKARSTTSVIWTVGQDFSSIQEAIDAANPGDTIHVQAGHYLENIVVDKPLTIRGEGILTTFIRSPTGNQISTAAVDIEADNVTISGFTILDGYTGIRCYSGWDNLSIADNHIGTNFVGIATVGLAPDFSTYNRLVNNDVVNNNCGIFLWATDSTSVEANGLYGNGIGIQINGPASNNKVFHNNMAGGDQLQAYVGAGNTIWDDGYPSGGNYWHGHELVDQYRGPNQDIPGPDGICDTPHILNADNQDRYPLVTYFSAYRVRNIDTGLSYAKIQEAIDAPETLDGHALEVSAGTYYDAVTVHKSLSLTGHGKTATIIEGGGKDEPAFRVWAVNNVFISGFTFQNFTTGVSVENSNNTIVEDNIIRTCIHGLYVSNSYGNRVVGNTFTGNQYGVYFDLASGTSNNSFFHNNFIDNKQQVYNNPAHPSVNVWNDSYPSGGNYWSDYTGADEFTGPYQNMTGSDGIGDTPYVIDANNRDNYPQRMAWANVVTVLNISASKNVTNDTIVYVTVIMHVSLDYHGQLEVTAFCNSTLIATRTAGNEVYTFAPLVVFPFRLNTTVMPEGSYLLSANVSAVPGETCTTDNAYAGSMFKEVMRGDIDGNAVVNIIDITTVAVAYNSSTVREDINHDGIVDETDLYIAELAIFTTPGQPGWNPDADLNNDGKINVAIEIASISKKFGSKATARWNPNADWDRNGVINILDITAAAVNFGKTG